MKVFLATGEVSGDAAAAALVRELRQRRPGSDFFGIGGSRMAEAGVHIDFPTNHLGTIGVSEAVSILPALWRAFGAVRRRVRETPPDVAVLIGNDVFNVCLGRWLRRRQVPTVSYFPPQVWIWGAVAGLTVRSFDAVLSCFPEEHEVYARAAQRAGRAASFVGHYLADQLVPRSVDEMLACRRRLGVAEAPRVVGLFPGSRGHEVRALAPRLLDAAEIIRAATPDVRFLVPVADPELEAFLTALVDARSLAVEVTLCRDGREALRASDVVVLASGTASLEASLLGVPMVVVYRVSRITKWIVDAAVGVGLMGGSTVALPNLLLGREVVRELKQGAVTGDAIAAEVGALVADPARAEEMRVELGRVAEQVAAGGSLGLVADEVVDVVGRSKHAGASIGRFTRMLAWIAALLFRAYAATLRVCVVAEDGTILSPRSVPREGRIFAVSERDALALGGSIVDAGFTALVTVGRDGDRAAALLERLGCRVVRGSSRQRGAAALHELMRSMTDGDGSLAVVVDGPLGPVGRAKSGAVLLGMLGGRTVHAISAAASHAFTFPKTWSGIYLPLPFSRVVVACDEALPVPTTTAWDEIEKATETLSGRLGALRERALRAVRRGKGVAIEASSG